MQTTSADGTVIGWDESGSGPTLLLVHGGGADSSVWSRVRARLPDGIRVVTLDRRGRGRSGDGDAGGYSFDAEADDILGVAAAAGGGVVVAAHSVGATIVLQALLRAGSLVDGAILYEPPLPGMPSGVGAPPHLRAALDDGRYDEALVYFLRDYLGVPAEDVSTYRTLPSWPSRVALMATMSREAVALDALDADTARYSAVALPVRLLVGSRTVPAAADGVAALAAVLPHSDVVVLEGVGHGGIVEAPDLVAAAIADFVRGSAA